MTDGTSIYSRPEKVVRQAEMALADSDSSPFSPPAFRVLKAKVSEYVVELVNESVKVSRRHVADTVSAAHVERAAQYLVASTSHRLYKHLGTVGGILLGAALSNLLAMVLAGQYTGQGTILSAAFGITGAFLIAMYIAKD